MSIPGKMLVAVLVALAVSALAPMFSEQVPFELLIGPTAVAAILAVLLSHRAVPMPASLAAKEPRKASAPGTTPARAPRKSPRSEKAPRPEKPQKGATKSAVGSETGTVKWFNSSKGFGFIVRDNGDEIFVHHRSIQGDGRRSLRDGASVRFSVVTTDKGPQAEDVEQVD